MTSEPFGLLAVFVYFAAVVLSIPAAAGVLLLGRRFGIRRATDLVGLAFVGVVALGGLVVAVVTDPIAGVLLAGFGLLALVLLWAVPVLVGAYVVERLESTTGETALGFAVAGLPGAMLVSAILFLAPGGLARYNLTFLSGPVAWLFLLAFGAVVLVGPGLVGVGLYRFAGRRE